MISGKEMFEGNIKKVLEYTKQYPNSVNARIELGLISCDFDKLEVEFSYSRKEEHLNTYNQIHGGITSAILDTCIGFAAVGASGHYVSTTEMTTSYINGMEADDFVIKVKLIKVGKYLIRGTGQIEEKDTKKICATAMASYFATQAME